MPGPCGNRPCTHRSTGPAEVRWATYSPTAATTTTRATPTASSRSDWRSRDPRRPPSHPPVGPAGAPRAAGTSAASSGLTTSSKLPLRSSPARGGHGPVRTGPGTLTWPIFSARPDIVTQRGADRGSRRSRIDRLGRRGGAAGDDPTGTGHAWPWASPWANRCTSRSSVGGASAELGSGLAGGPDRGPDAAVATGRNGADPLPVAHRRIAGVP